MIQTMLPTMAKMGVWFLALVSFAVFANCAALHPVRREPQPQPPPTPWPGDPAPLTPAGTGLPEARRGRSGELQARPWFWDFNTGFER